MFTFAEWFSFFWSCCPTCGIPAPDQGLNLGLWQWVKVQSLNHWTAREFPTPIKLQRKKKSDQWDGMTENMKGWKNLLAESFQTSRILREDFFKTLYKQEPLKLLSLGNTEIMIPKCDLIQFQRIQLKVELIHKFKRHGASLDNRRLRLKVINRISATF